MGLADTVPGAAVFTGLKSSAPARPTAQAATATLAAGVGAGAAAGATIGSIVPGIGTLIGGAVGAIVGAVPGVISMVGALQGGTTQAQRLASFNTGIQQAVGRLPGVVALLQQASDQVTRYQSLAAGTPSPVVTTNLVHTPPMGVNCGGGTSCHGSDDMASKIKEVSPLVDQLSEALSGGPSVSPATLAAMRADLAFGQQAVAAPVPPATPAGYPTSEAAWRDLDAFERAAWNDLGILRGVGTSPADALAAATSANQALVAASQKLLADVNAFQAGIPSINPWTSTPAGDADARIDGEADDVRDALATAAQANSALQAALVASTGGSS